MLHALPAWRIDRCFVAMAWLAAVGAGSQQVQAQDSKARPRTSGAAPKGAWRPARPEALPAKLDYVPIERFDQIRALISGASAEGGTLFTAPDGKTSYMLVLRTKESDVEEHSRWDDIVIGRSGSGSIVVAPRTSGARVVAPGEMRGGRLMASTTLGVRVGDVVRIPAGVPHSFRPDGSQPWEFLIVKVRRPERPLRGAPR